MMKNELRILMKDCKVWKKEVVSKFAVMRIYGNRIFLEHLKSNDDIIQFGNVLFFCLNTKI